MRYKPVLCFVLFSGTGSRLGEPLPGRVPYRPKVQVGMARCNSMLLACVDTVCTDANSRDPVTLDTGKLGTAVVRVSVPVGWPSDGILAIGVRGANNADILYKDGIQISAVSNSCIGGEIGEINMYKNCKGRRDVASR